MVMLCIMLLAGCVVQLQPDAGRRPEMPATPGPHSPALPQPPGES